MVLMDGSTLPGGRWRHKGRHKEEGGGGILNFLQLQVSLGHCPPSYVRLPGHKGEGRALPGCPQRVPPCSGLPAALPWDEATLTGVHPYRRGQGKGSRHSQQDVMWQIRMEHAHSGECRIPMPVTVLVTFKSERCPGCLWSGVHVPRPCKRPAPSANHTRVPSSLSPVRLLATVFIRALEIINTAHYDKLKLLGR